VDGLLSKRLGVWTQRLDNVPVLILLAYGVFFVLGRLPGFRGSPPPTDVQK